MMAVPLPAELATMTIGCPLERAIAAMVAAVTRGELTFEGTTRDEGDPEFARRVVR